VTRSISDFFWAHGGGTGWGAVDTQAFVVGPAAGGIGEDIASSQEIAHFIGGVGGSRPVGVVLEGEPFEGGFDDLGVSVLVDLKGLVEGSSGGPTGSAGLCLNRLNSSDIVGQSIGANQAALQLFLHLGWYGEAKRAGTALKHLLLSHRDRNEHADGEFALCLVDGEDTLVATLWASTKDIPQVRDIFTTAKKNHARSSFATSCWNCSALRAEQSAGSAIDAPMARRMLSRR